MLSGACQHSALRVTELTSFLPSSLLLQGAQHQQPTDPTPLSPLLSSGVDSVVGLGRSGEEGSSKNKQVQSVRKEKGGTKKSTDSANHICPQILPPLPPCFAGYWSPGKPGGLCTDIQDIPHSTPEPTVFSCHCVDSWVPEDSPSPWAHPTSSTGPESVCFGYRGS